MTGYTVSFYCYPEWRRAAAIFYQVTKLKKSLSPGTLLILFLLTGCGSSSDSSDDDSATDTGSETSADDPITGLKGSWLTKCFSEPEVLADYTSNLLSTFDNGTITSIVTGYDDTSCSGNIITQEIFTFTYKLGDTITIDGSVAGITTATEIDVTETTEDSLDFGEKSFDIIAVNGDKMYVGDLNSLNNGTTEALRATKLDADNILTRQ